MTPRGLSLLSLVVFSLLEANDSGIMGNCRYEQTLSALATVLNLNLEPLQRDIIEAPLDPDVRPKDTWDPHCDRIDKALHQKVTSLHEHIADIPNQIAAVEAAGAAESAKQKIQFERVIAQMKTKLIRKEAMFDALTKQLDEVSRTANQPRNASPSLPTVIAYIQFCDCCSLPPRWTTSNWRMTLKRSGWLKANKSSHAFERN